MLINDLEIYFFFFYDNNNDDDNEDRDSDCVQSYFSCIDCDVIVVYRIIF